MMWDTVGIIASVQQAQGCNFLHRLAGVRAEEGQIKMPLERLIK